MGLSKPQSYYDKKRNKSQRNVAKQKFKEYRLSRKRKIDEAKASEDEKFSKHPRFSDPTWKCQITNDDGKIKLTCKSEISEQEKPDYVIYNLELLNNHLAEITAHTLQCYKTAPTGPPVTLVGERKQLGLASIIDAKCNNCHKRFFWRTSKKINTGNENHFDINVRAVWGTVVTGNGASDLNELSGTMGLGGMSNRCFSKIEDEIGKWWAAEVEKEIVKNHATEIDLAKSNGHFYKDMPALTVIGDGGWSMRSNKHRFYASGGVAILFGRYSGKPLYIGIKNKYCILCDRNQNTPHECYKNWDKSSGAMESEMMVEAFNKAESYGARYMYYIGDGDSSVLSVLKEKGPDWCKDVKKVECANHTCKNLRTHLEKLVQDKPEYKGASKLSKLRRMKIVSGIRCAIKMRAADKNNASTDSGKKDALKQLKHDIKNSFNHVFGDHRQCSTDFCVKRKAQSPEISETSEEPSDPVEDQIVYWKDTMDDSLMNEARIACEEVQNVDASLRADVNLLLNRLSDKADKLIDNATTNLCESWMSIRSKFDGGKQIFRCMRGSWHTRCNGAALRKSHGPKWAPVVWRNVTHNTPGRNFSQRYNSIARNHYNSLANSRKPINIKKRIKRKYARIKEGRSKEAKKSYGPKCDQTDTITTEQLNDLKKKFFKDNVVVSPSKRISIEKYTRQQSVSIEWKQERLKRLTASKFGRVYKRRPNTPVSPLVQQIVYPTGKSTLLMQKGLRQERFAKQQYVEEMRIRFDKHVKLFDKGLVIHPEYPQLAASVDAIVQIHDGNDNVISTGVWETKDVLNNKMLTFSQAARQNVNNFPLKVTSNGKLTVKKDHDFYIQVQGQMNCLQLSWGHLVIRSTDPPQIHIEEITLDVDLWKSLLPKLLAFYEHALLPELASPRFDVGGIREPGPIWCQKFQEGSTRKQIANKSKTGKSREYTGKGSSENKRNKKGAKSSQPLSSSDEEIVPPDKTTESSLQSNSRELRRSKREKPPTGRRSEDGKPLFLGEQLRHRWEIEGGLSKWYSGFVIRLLSGTDGENSAEYEIDYNIEGDHDDDHELSILSYNELMEDLRSGDLIIIA